MEEELRLRPEELFYLGKLMDGVYYNYSYFAAIEGVQAGSKAYQWKSKENLVARGILQESFSGDPEVSTGAKKLLTPVLFGKFQSLLQICENGTETTLQEIHFHWHEKNGTMLYMYDGQMVLREMDEATLQNLVLGLMPEDYNSRPAPREVLQVTLSESSKIYSFQNFHPEHGTVRWVVYECRGWLCECLEDGTVALVAPKTFVDRAGKVLMEV